MKASEIPVLYWMMINSVLSIHEGINIEYMKLGNKIHTMKYIDDNIYYKVQDGDDINEYIIYLDHVQNYYTKITKNGQNYCTIDIDVECGKAIISFKDGSNSKITIKATGSKNQISVKVVMDSTIKKPKAYLYAISWVKSSNIDDKIDTLHIAEVWNDFSQLFVITGCMPENGITIVYDKNYFYKKSKSKPNKRIYNITVDDVILKYRKSK